MKRFLRTATPLLVVASMALLVMVVLSDARASRIPDAEGTRADGLPDRETPAGSPTVVSTRSVAIAAKDLKRRLRTGSPAPSYLRKGIKWALGAHSPDPAWSFDGSRIAFHDGVCVTIRTAAGEIDRTLRPRGKARGHMGEGCRSPRWSHDGKQIVTSHSFHGPGMLFDVGSKRGRLVKPRDNGLWSLTFAPGDAYLVGRVHQTGAVLVPMEATGKVIALTSRENGKLEGYFPSISPDGRHAARVLGEAWQQGGRLEIIGIELGTDAKGKAKDPWESLNSKGDYPAVAGRQIAVIETKGPILDVAWGPDGTRLVLLVTSKWYGGYDVYVYPAGEIVLASVKGNAIRQTGVFGRNPVWSPDGTYVAFDRPGGGIWLMDVSGDDPRPWRIHPRGIEPRWAPKGDRFFVLDPREGTGEILKLSR